MKRRKKAQRATLLQSRKIYFPVTLNCPFSFFLMRERESERARERDREREGRERETHLASQFCRQRTGRYRFGRPIRSKRSSRENLYMTTSHSSATSTTANVSFSSLRSQIQPSPLLSHLQPDPIFLVVVALSFSELFFHESFAGSRLGKRRKERRKKERFVRLRESVCHTHIHPGSDI